MPEVLVALVIGGVLIAGLTALEVQLARSGLQVSRVAELMVTSYALGTVPRCRTRPEEEIQSIAKIYLPGKGPLTLETGAYVRSDQRLAAGVGYVAAWSKDRRLLWGSIGERCGLAERCEYDVDLGSCRPSGGTDG
jgi:hypothetical protein